MNDKASRHLGGLAGKIVAEGLISAEDATAAQRASHEAHLPFVKYVVEHKGVDSMRLAEVAATEFGVPLLDLRSFNDL